MLGDSLADLSDLDDLGKLIREIYKRLNPIKTYQIGGWLVTNN